MPKRSSSLTVKLSCQELGCSTAVGKSSLATLRPLTSSEPDGSAHFRWLERLERALWCFRALTLTGTFPPRLDMYFSSPSLSLMVDHVD